MAIIKSYSDLQQSKKLAEILPLESADMYYDRGGLPSLIDKYVTHESIKNDKYHHLIPCWSLAALLGVIPNYKLSSEHNYHTCAVEIPFGKETVAWFDNPVDACVVMIERLHKLKML